MFNELPFSPSPSPSMNTLPLPSMHMSLSTPECMNSEVKSSSDAFSDLSRLVECLDISSRKHRSIGLHQLKRMVM